MNVLLKINGMTCQNCVRHVREALQKVHGVVSAEVDLDKASASVQTIAGDAPATEALLEAVKKADYEAELNAG